MSNINYISNNCNFATRFWIFRIVCGLENKSVTISLDQANHKKQRNDFQVKVQKYSKCIRFLLHATILCARCLCRSGI